jgi:RNA polymerase sigma factor for flagellar operon FliA
LSAEERRKECGVQGHGELRAEMSVALTPAETNHPRLPVRANRAKDAARVEASIPFVEALARRMAATMPHSIDLSDLVQDGVIGLIDAAERFDEGRGIKFETFAERRIRGAMIDALRKDAWPRGVRRVRRELEAAREKLRVSLGHEPSLSDLAAAIGADEKRLGKTIVRINTIESTSPLSCGDHVDEAQLPAVLVPAEPERPDHAYERTEIRDRVRAAIETLPARERRVISLYYYGEVTMKEIGAELGVNESRVSQLHARALRRLREALGAEMTPAAVATIRTAILAFAAKPKMAKAALRHESVVNNPESDTQVAEGAQRRAVVVDYASASRAARSKSPSRNGLASQRQPVSSRNRSASVPATAPVTKMTRRANDGVAAAIAR